MKSENRFAKLYKELTSKEQAATAFTYASNADQMALERVAAAVPLESYRGLGMDYLRWFNAFSHLGAIWALSYWKNACRLLGAGMMTHSAVNDRNLGEALKMIAVQEQAESRLRALDNVLEELCGEHGLDPAAVRSMAGTEPPDLSRHIEPDAEYQTTMRVELSRLLEA
jgi:hypothetical protein